MSGTIGRSASDTHTRTVGAVHLAVSGESISSAGRHVFAETVAGAKLTVAKKGIAQSAGKLMAHTAGGAVFRKTKGDMGYGAKKHRVTVGGLARLSTERRWR